MLVAPCHNHTTAQRQRCCRVAAVGPSLSGMPEKMPELLFLKQACLNYCFRAYLAYLLPGTRQARLQAFKAQQNNAVSLELPKSGERGYCFRA